ncbi:MAG TPA: hypothetical protein VGN49_11120 [Micrococcaceae bacterium]|jgi:hypothetical protein|nr:hypothetical protein [Micrococcaceae bacterium]
MASEDGSPGTPDKDEDAGVDPEGADSGTEEKEQQDNPLAHVDPEKAASTGKSMFNDPKADPLWNPSLEPEQAPGTQGVPGAGTEDDDDGRRPETD